MDSSGNTPIIWLQSDTVDLTSPQTPRSSLDGGMLSNKQNHRWILSMSVMKLSMRVCMWLCWRWR